MRKQSPLLFYSMQLSPFMKKNRNGRSKGGRSNKERFIQRFNKKKIGCKATLLVHVNVYVPDLIYLSYKNKHNHKIGSLGDS